MSTYKITDSNIGTLIDSGGIVSSNPQGYLTGYFLFNISLCGVLVDRIVDYD